MRALMAAPKRTSVKPTSVCGLSEPEFNPNSPKPGHVWDAIDPGSTQIQPGLNSGSRVSADKALTVDSNLKSFLSFENSTFRDTSNSCHYNIEVSKLHNNVKKSLCVAPCHSFRLILQHTL